jgi:uncharacterized membrane protein YbhN (UPF0104 family)
MRTPLRWLSAHYVDRPRRLLAAIIVVATLLEIAAGAGLAYMAGFGRMRAVVAGFDPGWLAWLAAAMVVSFIGYYCGYQGIFRVEGGPVLPLRQMHAVVAASFGGFLAHGGGALDQYALEAAGADEDDARARATSLSGMEQGVLAIGGCAAAIAVLVSGLSRPNPSYTLPWAIVPIPGMLIAFWLAERYRHRFTGKTGWRRAVCRFLHSIHIIRVLFTHPLRWGWTVTGMALFWAADAAAAWAGLAAFGYHMNVAALFVGFTTGMVFSRRTGPLAGAGVLAVLLPFTLWVSGAPFAVAVAGVFTYRVLAMWLPVPMSIAVVPTLRAMGRRRQALLLRRVSGRDTRGQRRPPSVAPCGPSAAAPVADAVVLPKKAAAATALPDEPAAPVPPAAASQ